MKNIIALFLNNTKFSEREVLSCSAIKSGFSDNDNFIITLVNDMKFHIRIANQNIDRNNEITIYKEIFKNDVLYIDNEGLLIRKWIEGKTPDLSSDKDLISTLKSIKEFHNNKIPNNIKEFSYEAYSEVYDQIDKELLKEFQSAIIFLKKEEKCLIHGDINELNLIKTNKDIFLIDFEWASFGSKIIDYASLLAFSDANINVISEFTGIKNEILDFIKRFLLILSILWALKVKTKKSNELINKCLSKL